MELKITQNLKKYINFKDGFFIEAGAYDGLFQSNTLYLEKELNWTGLLIEPNFINYLLCLKNRPNIKTINCGLVSFKTYLKKKTVLLENNASPMDKIISSGIFNKFNKIFSSKKLTQINVLPLTILLQKLNIKKVDLLSLDVEGYELNALKGINFTDIEISYICIEVWSKDKENIFNFLENKNYKLISNLSNFNKNDYPKWSGDHNDYLFKLSK